MTDRERVDQIRARLAAATPGPWEREPYNVWLIVGQPDDIFESIVCRVLSNHLDADARLITNAPEDLRWLLDQADRLDKLTTRLREMCGETEQSGSLRGWLSVQAVLRAVDEADK